MDRILGNGPLLTRINTLEDMLDCLLNMRNVVLGDRNGCGSIQKQILYNRTETATSGFGFPVALLFKERRIL